CAEADEHYDASRDCVLHLRDGPSLRFVHLRLCKSQRAGLGSAPVDFVERELLHELESLSGGRDALDPDVSAHACGLDAAVPVDRDQLDEALTQEQSCDLVAEVRLHPT